MFATQHDNPPSLRQGDIIADVFFPLARPSMLKYLGSYRSGTGVNISLSPVVETPQGSKKQYVNSIVQGVIAHGAVISQCCDLDRSHPSVSFSLCRIIPFETKKFRNTTTLINNIDPWGPENPYFEFFYLGELSGLAGEYLADFGLVTSFSWSDYDLTLSKKLHQLDDSNRNKFRVKLGAFWGRPTREDVEAGQANPYEPSLPSRPSRFTRMIRYFKR